MTIIRRIGARRTTLSVRPSGEIRLTHPFFTSRARALSFLESKVEWIERTRERLKARCESMTAVGATSQSDIEELRRAAKAWLPQRVEALARQYGFRYGRVTIRASRSRWGSCTAENNISLSLYLMRLPEHLRDYVILHELCHTVHHNHSSAFHNLCDRCLDGNEKILRRELRRYTMAAAPHS